MYPLKSVAIIFNLTVDKLLGEIGLKELEK